MNALNIEHIRKNYGDRVIFDDISVGIQEGEKIGIVGINGTGKSTLLKIIAGIEEAEDGEIIIQNGLHIAYLPQIPNFPEHATVLSYVLEGRDQEDWTLLSEAKNILNKLGITNVQEEIAHLSGGQKKRAALARTLCSSFQILILDEPTNHLDEEMVTWLEEYLSRWKGVVIMVTHDRYFLDKVCSRILEISRGKLFSYEGNYSRFLELKALREEMELSSERKRQSILRMELEWAKRGCRARSTKQRARLERLETLKNGKAPVQEETVQMDSVETRMGKKTIELHHVTKGYGEKILIRDFDYIVLKNQRLGIIGPNGCGKSTLMKLIAGLVEPDRGVVEIGETIKIGYFAQEEISMNPDQKVIDYIKDIAEYIPTKEGRITASKLLERFLFDSTTQYTPIGKLSGGERRRLYLLGVLAEGANVLLFDEPSNNLDIPTLTILEDYLNSFTGIVITVSHDRYFLDNVVDRIFAFEEDGRLQQYEGGYTDYLEAREYRRKSQKNNTIQEKKTAEERSWKKERPVKLKFTYKEQREYETIDDEISSLEEKIADLEQQMEKNASQYIKLSELTKEKEQAESTLEEKMERWVYLNDLAEQIQAQNE